MFNLTLLQSGRVWCEAGWWCSTITVVSARGGITRLVNEERSKTDRLMLHNLNGHAVFVKL